MGMTERDRKLLAIFAVLILLGGYWFLVLGKKKSALAEAEAAKTAAQTELENAQVAAAAGKLQKKRYPVSYSRLVKLGKAIPEGSDYASLLIQVNDVSEQSGVRFESLMSAEGAPGTNVGVTGLQTTCGEGGSTAAAGATGATGATSATGATGATQANSGVGQAINDANASADAAGADAQKSADASAEDCSQAPSLTDLAAQAAGLELRTFTFKFKGSFFNLHEVMANLMDLVRTNNGKVKVTGRLLQINTITMGSTDFPDINADIEMTGYSLPDSASATAGATPAAPAGAPATEPASTEGQ